LFFGSAILLFDLYSKNRTLEPLVIKYGLFFAFFLALISSIATLIYSEIFGFVPCGLCWLQRVFLYPQVLLLATALYLKDKGGVIYASVLCVPGFFVSLYQHYLQMGGSEFITCPTAGAGVNCADRILFEFGFMTFPLMSAALFVFLFALFIYIAKTSSLKQRN
jgi:disulfide bond formation protein DsbB